MATKQKPSPDPVQTLDVTVPKPKRGPGPDIMAGITALNADKQYAAARDRLQEFCQFVQPEIETYVEAKDAYTAARKAVAAAEKPRLPDLCRDMAIMALRAFEIVPETRQRERRFLALMTYQLDVLVKMDALSQTYRSRFSALLAVCWWERSGLVERWSKGQYDSADGLDKAYKVVRALRKLEGAKTPDAEAKRRAIKTDAVQVKAATFAASLTVESWQYVRDAIDRIMADRAAATAPTAETKVEKPSRRRKVVAA